MHIVFYGPEGSGKGTQADFLSKALNLPLLVSGDLVREMAEKDKGLMGEICREALESGKYVADSEMYVLWKRRLKQKDALKGWIIDGFPRNIEQAKFLVDKIDKYGYKVDKVIYLNIPEEVSFARLSKRKRKLFDNSRTLHDSPKRINERLKIYKKGEKEVLEYFGKLGVLLEINGNQPVNKVFSDIKKGLNCF